MDHHSELTMLDNLLRRRHSCRGFLSEPVPRKVIEQVLAVAQLSASWCNAQPWQVQVVSGARLEAMRQELWIRAQQRAPADPELDWPKEYRGLYLARRRECGLDLYRATGVKKGDREASARQSHENFRLFGAPHLIIVTSPKMLGTHGVMDCGAWVANFMLAATAAGIAAIAQAALASWPDILRKHLDIAADHRIVCGISFGYEDPEHPANHFRTSRAPLEEVVTWVE